MPLKDLLSKIPTPVPPTEEPWPKPPTRKVVSPRLKNSNYKNSPLYSATSRPTLDEFLRTNYLMTPEFVKQVGQAKKAAGIGESGQGVQNTASQQTAVNFGDGMPTVFSADQNQAVSCNIDEAKTAKNDGTTAKYSNITGEIHRARSADKFSALFSRKQVTSEIQVPPPQKPRVKKVMKGGSLVTIPAPQPRNRAVHSTPGSADNADKPTTSSVTGENDVDETERGNLKETEEEACIKEARNNQSAVKEDSSIFYEEATCSHVQKEVSTKGSKHLQSEVLLEKCAQKEVSLASIINSDILKQSKVSLGSSQDLPVGSNPSKTRASLHKESDIFLHTVDTQVIVNKDLGGVCDKGQDQETIKHLKTSSIEMRSLTAKVSVEKSMKELIRDHTLGKNIVSEAVAEKSNTHPEKITSVFMKDHKEIKISGDVIGEGKKGIEGGTVFSNLMNTDKSFDLPLEVVVKRADKEVSLIDEKEVKCIKEPSNNEEWHGNDKNSATKVSDLGITGSTDSKDGCGDDVDVYVEDCDVTTAINDYKGKSDDGSYVGNDDSGSEDDDDDGNGKGGSSVSAKDKPVVGESDDEYAELIMEDSNSEEEEEDDFIPRNNSDSDEEEGELQSDYEPEDMNLDSETEKSTGGIMFYKDTTLRKSKNRSRSKQKGKRKAKNQRKRASKKKAKVEKKAATERSNSFDSSRKRTNVEERHMHAAASQMSVAKDRFNNQVPDTQKSTETSLKLPENKLPGPGPGPGQSTTCTLEEGSLLSMVSSYTVDVTVAASEKLALKRSRGGQHSKKVKKAKRRAAALERIRRGEPHPRPRHVPPPKPICNYYIQGKCRMGSECSFRHDKSAIVRKRELCKFYTSNSCNLGDDCPYMHSSFPCKYFHTGSICRAGDCCKFSHDALTEETGRLLQLLLYPPVQDPVQSAADKNSAPVGYENPGKSQPVAGTSTCKEDTQVPASSPYNLRTSPRKRRLGTDGDGHVTGQKTSRQESTSEEANNAGQSSLFLPGLYKDLSI